jgi:Domain of unknown function (DUF4115)
VPVAGTASPNAKVTVTAKLVRPPQPNFTITDGADQRVRVEPVAPAPPDPLRLTADAQGGFRGELALRPGRWRLNVASEGGEPIGRRVDVRTGDGVRATLHLNGAASYLEVEEDGTAVDGVSGGIAAAGDRITLVANDDIRIFAGNAGAVRVTINGVGIGVMGADGAVVEWRITRAEG